MDILKNNKPVGLVLEGGGAKGAYQIGAWKAMRELGVEIDTVTGTSVGALNGALIAQGDFDLAYDLWNNMSPSMVLKGDSEVLDRIFKYDFRVEDVQTLGKYIRNVIGRGGLDITPLRNLIKKNIDEDKVRKSSIRLGIVTISLTDLKPIEVFIEDIPQGKLHDYLIASANLPIFKFEKIGEKFYLDGGFYDNQPIGLMASTGQKNIISVELKTIAIRKKSREEDLNIINITPSDDIGKLLEFNVDTARKNLKLGYYDALKTLQGLKGTYYYIENELSESEALDIWTKVSDETVNKLINILGILSEGSKKRILFEKIIPRIVEILDLEPEHTYGDIVIAMYEHLAKKKGIERFKVYQYKDFKEVVSKKCINIEPMGINKIDVQLPRLLKQSNILLKALNEDVVEKVIRLIMID